jgi:hypothetical protein
MKKKRSPGSRLISNSGPHNPVVNRRNVPAKDLFLYARSFHKAAKALAGSLRLDTGPFADSDVSPVVFMYRHAVELHLKAMVLGEGGNFLAPKPDALSVHKIHSVSWLAQFVCQIITAVKGKTNSSARASRTLPISKRWWRRSIPSIPARMYSGFLSEPREAGFGSGPCQPDHP